VLSSQINEIFLIYTCLLGALILLPAGQTSAENERYKAIRMASGGFVFILDTREGHVWMWNNALPFKKGKNLQISYQLKVPMNMNPPQKSSI